MKKVTRNMLREYYGIPSTGGAWVYHYVNPGFTQLNESGGAQVERTAFIGDKNASPSVTGYENQWAFESQYVKDEPVVEDILSIARGQLVGEGCERRLVSIDLNDPAAGEGLYNARMFSIVVEAAPPKGEPRQVTTLSGVFHQAGDLTPGTFDVAARAFTAGG